MAPSWEKEHERNPSPIISGEGQVAWMAQIRVNPRSQPIELERSISDLQSG